MIAAVFERALWLARPPRSSRVTCCDRRRPSADDNRPPSCRRLLDDVRKLAFAAGRRVVDAQRLATFIDAIETVGRTDAGANARLLAGFHLPDDVGIGNVRACHPDHIELALGNCVACRGDICDARCVKHRKPGRRSDFPGKNRDAAPMPSPGSG